jgi:ATP-dependent Lhr-like helicase
VSGAYLIVVDGEPALYLERSRKGLLTLPAFDASAPHALSALRRIAENTTRRELVIDQVDGEPSLNSALRPLLEQSGFAREYLGLTLRLPTLSHPQARSA